LDWHLYYALKEDWSSCWHEDLADGATTFRGFFGEYQIIVEGYE
jgi:hypothetical protein